jgi:hypothetical protein
MKVLSMKGKEVDMGLLMSRNETAVAVGNAGMNARGDLISRRGGAIIKTREAITQEYYAASPKAVKQVSLRSIQPDNFATPADAVASILGTAQAGQTAAKQTAQQPRKRKTEDRD